MQVGYSESESKKVAEKLLSLIAPHKDKATVVGLSGDLGAGKTTLTKAIAELLGVTEVVQSPTFVVAKFYTTNHEVFSDLVHMDAYRIESIDELVPLHFEKILAKPNTLVIIEWAERIASALPEDTHSFSILHDGNKRTITYDRI